MKTLILLLCILSTYLVGQTKDIFFAHKAHVIGKDKEIKQVIETDFRITIDYKLKIVSILTDKTEDAYSFKNIEVRDFKDGKGDRMFFEFSESAYYKTLMLWHPNNDIFLMFTPANTDKEVLFFRNPKVIESN